MDSESWRMIFMKETPIIMSGNHPKLVLDGTKTMTRRVIKPQPKPYLGYMMNYEGTGAIQCGADYPDTDEDFVKCPYGQVGDRLWVRETFTWVYIAEKDPWKDRAIADGTFRRMPNGEPVKMCYKADGYEIGARWYPSIHMPRWASRITLEITEVRVERVQEISDTDARNEGITPDFIVWGDCCYTDGFIRLWNSLNAKRGYGWEVNPWVWVISFKVLKDIGMSSMKHNLGEFVK